MKTLALSILLTATSTLAFLGSTQIASKKDTTDKLPRIIIWSWEHDDNLEFLDPKETAVAKYAGTILLGRETATLKPRRNLIKLTPRIAQFPVFRIENVHADEAPSKAALARAIELITDCQKDAGWTRLQIDYDAGIVERAAYLQFLSELKSKLASGTRISITALSSWCLSDKWLDKATIDESVAMLFSMGKGKAETLAALANNRRLDSGADCRQSIGLSINESKTNLQLKESGTIKSAEHIYLFSSVGWNLSKYEEFKTRFIEK